jgi:hypothetical protein
MPKPQELMRLSKCRYNTRGSPGQRREFAHACGVEDGHAGPAFPVAVCFNNPPFLALGGRKDLAFHEGSNLSHEGWFRSLSEL